MISETRMLSDRKVFLICLLYFSLLLLLVSPDSWLYGIYGHIDSSYFFMGGKAMMNGLRPYVDFADSKGPLLWFIYGIGYLISNTSFTGIYFISSLWYGLIGLYAFKLARLYLLSDTKALACTALMAVAYLNPWSHFEFKSEEVGQLFTVVSFYYATKYMLEESPSDKLGMKVSFILGISFMSLVLIKYSLAAMFGILPIYVLIFAIRRRRSIVAPLGSFFAGAAVMALPFVVYLLSVGSMEAMVSEYFLNTMQTVSRGPWWKSVADDWSRVLIEPVEVVGKADFSIPGLLLMFEVVVRPIFISVALAGCVLFCIREKRLGFLPVIAFGFYCVVSLMHAMWPYYYNSLTFFFIYLVMYVMSVKKPSDSVILVAKAAVVSFFLIVPLSIMLRNSFLCFVNKIDKNDFLAMTRIIEKENLPTIAYIGLDTGAHVSSEALPAFKYWASQMGATYEMRKEQKDGLLSGKAMFIYLHSKWRLEELGVKISDIEAAGYKLVAVNRINNNMLFQRK